MRALLIIGCTVILSFLEKVIFVGDVERRKDCETDGVDCIGGFSDGAHLGVDVLGELEYVVGIGAPQVIGLIEYLDPDG